MIWLEPRACVDLRPAVTEAEHTPFFKTRQGRRSRACSVRCAIMLRLSRHHTTCITEPSTQEGYLLLQLHVCITGAASIRLPKVLHTTSHPPCNQLPWQVSSLTSACADLSPKAVPHTAQLSMMKHYAASYTKSPHTSPAYTASGVSSFAAAVATLLPPCFRSFTLMVT